ncbi:hypothetical protein FHR32_002153 [Streptosporangium album]|uniref:Uncharacterized protein n=1 Tax=Streptosporangium album TaxID=47479 RepID=A0A7W7RTC2_9ACTN|nr:DUF6339 family protein [Streptosporangium album]MBB4937848.1 hypothetical protein [Streptosporangium album]
MTIANAPTRLALLPDSVVVKHLTLGVRTGSEKLPQAALAKACVALDETPRWEAAQIRELLDEAMRRFDGSAPEADAWLAPRLHAVLRLTRREAADSRLWNFLCLMLAPDYVFWRHLSQPTVKKPIPEVSSARYHGTFHIQAFARLWWAAELFRDGDDYRPVEIACSNQDMLNTVLRLEIIHHRPTAQAIVHMLRRKVVHTGREVNALAKAVNAAGSTLLYEIPAPDEIPDADAYRAWIDEVDTALVPYDSLPEGPDDGGVPSFAVDVLIPLFEKLYVDAPVRGREQASPIEDTASPEAIFDY